MQKKQLQTANYKLQTGFTLMEILVATVIFALLSVALMSLFNYTLKINRKTDALRQAAQNMRGFIETLVKEAHNGQIDYGVESGKVLANVGSCPIAPPGTVGADYNGGEIYGPNGTNLTETSLGLINTDGDRVCIYLQGTDIMIRKQGIDPAQKMNPENFFVEPNGLKFYIRPRTDPYSHDSSGVYPKQQPFVTMVLNFKIQLSTGEKVPIFYQTTLDTNKYDVPGHD
jgi:prepilin-type N-terminal cleavage/methylation domain-containing protein